jgi:hypothetical protein
MSLMLVIFAMMVLMVVLMLLMLLTVRMMGMNMLMTAVLVMVLLGRSNGVDRYLVARFSVLFLRSMVMSLKGAT